MVTTRYMQYVVEQRAKRDTLIFKVWEPIQRGRFYREVKMFDGKLHGRKGTRFPYIKKSKGMSYAEHLKYKQNLDKQEQDNAYDIIEFCHPDIFTKKFLLVDGEVLVVLP